MTDDWITLPDGSKYRGECDDAVLPHGQGVAEWPGGSRYEGEWCDGMPHGQGVATFPDGERYGGGWRHGMPHGRV